MVEIVDIAAAARAKAAEQKAKEEEEKRTGGGPTYTDRVYEVKLHGKDPFQAAGTLMLTGAFFALGTPIGNTGAVDFNWASPVEQVEYVLALPDYDLQEDNG